MAEHKITARLFMLHGCPSFEYTQRVWCAVCMSTVPSDVEIRIVRAAELEWGNLTET